MSTQITLHERTDEMHDRMLESEGHLGGGMSGLMGQLNGDDYFDEFHDLLTEADCIIVGNSTDDGPSDVADLFRGVTMVTDRLIVQVEAIANDADDVDESVAEWLEGRDEVLAIHW